MIGSGVFLESRAVVTCELIGSFVFFNIAQKLTLNLISRLSNLKIDSTCAQPALLNGLRTINESVYLCLCV